MNKEAYKNDSRRYLSEILEPLDFNKPFKERQSHIENVLARYLNLKTVVALVGAGASKPLGYPLWNEFAKKILDITKAKFSEKAGVIERYEKYLGDIGKEMSAQVILEECERIFKADDEEKGIRYKEGSSQSKTFRGEVERYFKDHHISKDCKDKFDREKNPYVALLDLPIRRFITTNYDLEIERALLARKKIANNLSSEEICRLPLDKIIRETGGKSFSQKSNFCSELAKFPIARYEESEYTVFHCHGRIDDISSCVITEDDFQEWYLRDKTECVPFRQTLDLTLGSNPILIMGYGLGDLDLTRWLRTIAANRPIDKVRNPLFCLNYIPKSQVGSKFNTDPENTKAKWRSREEVEDECDALYLRYGLHVIPIYEKDPDSGKGMDLCQKLIQLKDSWRTWWDGILLKPSFKMTPSNNFKDSSYYHYRMDFDHSTKAIRSIQEDLEKELDKRFNGDQSLKLAVVVGNGGTGKSWSVQQYLQDKELEATENQTKEKFIFWSSYYANDVLTGIDRLIEYFERDETTKPVKSKKRTDESADATDYTIADHHGIEDRFKKLSHYLNEQENTLVVFDGIEKLLISNKKKTEGESISPEIKRFFQIISSSEIKCKIILTSRLFPIDVLEDISELPETSDNKEDTKPKKRLREDLEIKTPRCWSEDLLISDDGDASNGFTKLYKNSSVEERRQKFSSMCALVDGHTLCISLIRGILEDFSDTASDSTSSNLSEVDEKFEDLLRNVGNTPVDRRVYRVIKEAIHQLDISNKFNKGENIYEKFIERISLFMHPVRKEVAQICLDDIYDSAKLKKPSLNTILQNLVKKNLLQIVYLDIKTKAKGYVVHPLIRNYVYQNLHSSLFTSLPSIQLSGLTSAMETVDPGSEERGVKVSKNLFKVLCENASAPYAANKELNKNQKKIHLDYCRGAYSILRSRFCANTVTRWGDYREYLKILLNLYDTARKVSENVWKHNEPTPDGKKYSKSDFAPLYADEIAWIYNEIGLASISMGNLLNAIPFREQGLEINRLIDADRDGRYLFQSEFNLGVGYIHLGRLNFALNYLERAIEISNKLEDVELTSRVKAYVALIKYLQGSLEDADRDFRLAYRKMGDNPRAKGVFYCYHGELLSKLGKLDDAKEMISQSYHIGESYCYPDLIAYARLARGNILLKEDNYDEAQVEYSAAYKTARDRKIRRLETGVLSGMSRFSYKLNDSEIARQKAVESLKIANEYSLCLHQTVGLIVLGKALVKNGQRDLGIGCFKSAKTLAKSQSYFLRMNEAEYELQRLNSL